MGGGGVEWAELVDEGEDGVELAGFAEGLDLAAEFGDFREAV